jgi:chromosome segregation ATPase
MKKIWFCNLVLFTIILWASPGLAEFYRYQDAHGNVIYTDDLSKVPAEQRSKAEMYDESVTSPPPEATEEGESAGSASDDIEALKIEGERLLKLKGELDSEYQALAKENAELKTEQEAAVTPGQIKEVNNKVVNYNARFQAYREKSAAYETEVKAYNEKSKAYEEKSKSEPGAN